MPPVRRMLSRERCFRVLAVSAGLAAVFHAAAMASPAIARLEYEPTYPQWRHVAFIAIDASCAWLFLRRPAWFVWAYAVLTIQVLNGHGRGAWTIWATEGRVDWISVAVSIGAPVALWLLIVDWRERRSAFATRA